MTRVAELDAIRGLAALAILANHLPFSNRITHLGAYGVDLFFVLSGYLITSIILRDGGAPGFLRAFYARRSLRIWPIYYLSLAAVIAVNPLFRPPFRLDGWPYYATYTQGMQDYGSAPVPPFSPLFDHTWTLALEEQYYLAWPALALVFGRRSIPALGLGLAALALIARASGFSDRLLIGRCDGFALGGVLAALLSAPVTRPGRALGGFGLVAIGAVGLWATAGLIVGRDRPGVYASIRLLAASLGFFAMVGMILVRAGSRGLAPLRDWRLCYLGQISYGLYLYHYPVYWIFDAVTGAGARPWGVAAKVALSVALAAASWRLVESPILRLKDHFRYRPGPTVDAGERA